MNEGKNEVSTSAAGRLRPCPLMCDGQQACVSRAPEGTGATEIAHQLSIARSTVYKILEDERAS